MSKMMPPARHHWKYYLGAVVCVALTPAVTQKPGTTEFFLLQAFLWGLGSFFLCLVRKMAWEEAGMPQGPAWNKNWKESAPAWAFESSFLVQLVNVPFALAMSWKILRTRSDFDAAASKYLSDFGPDEDLWLEHVIFASLFGFMVRDVALHWRKPDPLITVHHVAVCILMVSFAFLPCPGARLCAWLTPVVEIGTSAYCAWVIWRTRVSYQVLMHLSNIAMVLSGSLCVSNAPPGSYGFYCLYVISLVLAVGRTQFLFAELKLYPA